MLRGYKIRKEAAAGCFSSRIRSSNILRSGLRQAGVRHQSAGLVHLDRFDSHQSKRKDTPTGCFSSRIRSSNRLRCHVRPAGHEGQSTGLPHLDGFDSRCAKIKRDARGIPFYFGAGYGSRTRLHGLGSRCITDIRILHLHRNYSRRRWEIQPQFVEGRLVPKGKVCYDKIKSRRF